jgi:hypothetical protein
MEFFSDSSVIAQENSGPVINEQEVVVDKAMHLQRQVE